MDTIRPWLLIGKYRDTIAPVALRAAQIDFILTVAEPITHAGMRCQYLPVEDGVALDPKLLRAGVDAIRAAHTAGERVLVACGAGISRSATFAIAALHEIEELALLDAARSVHQARPMILPHLALWESLCAHYGEPVPYSAVLRELLPM